MLSWIKNYWAELLVFGAIFAVLLIDCAPTMTWINTDSDGIHYTYAAKYLLPAHKTSAPLFLLLGHAFLWLPFGTEFWRFAMLSVLASTASAVFIYLIIKEKVGKEGRIYGLIGALVFGGSTLVISQSTIVEAYALMAMAGVGAYYFAIKRQWKRCALMLGTGFATHFMISLTAIVLLLTFKELRPHLEKQRLRNWTPLAIILSFFLFYLYIPITASRTPLDMWGNTTFSDFVNDNANTGLMLLGGLSIWDLPKRIFDTLGILGVSLGLAAIPIVLACWKRNWIKEPLVWLMLLPITIYATNLAPQTYVYMMPTIGFGAIAAGIGLAKMRPYWKWAVLGCAVGLLAFNANYLDIGRTLDPELSTSKYYYEELDKVPNGQILVAQQGWEWAAIPMYNKENNRNILPVCTGTLPSKTYQQSLKDMEIKFEIPEVVRYEFSSNIAASILELNNNVWLTTPSKPRTYGAEIVPAKGNEELLGSTSHAILSTQEWKWRPSNPYDIITGAIEVEEWVEIVVSNYSCLMFVMLGVIGAVPAWIGYMVIVEKKKWSLRKNKEVKANVANPN